MKKLILLLLFVPIVSSGQGLNGYEYVYVKSKNYDIANGVIKNDFLDYQITQINILQQLAIKY